MFYVESKKIQKIGISYLDPTHICRYQDENTRFYLHENFVYIFQGENDQIGQIC